MVILDLELLWTELRSKLICSLILQVSASYSARCIKLEQGHTACLLHCYCKLFPPCFCWGEVCFTSQLPYRQQSGENMYFLGEETS